jgi:hypothetical protein
MLGRYTGGSRPAVGWRRSSRQAVMLSYPSQVIRIVAVCGSDRPSEVNRSSPAGADTYSCESCNFGLIVAGQGCQNENKALRTKEIGQNQKKTTASAPVGTAWPVAFPGVFEGNRLSWMGGCEPKVSVFGPAICPNRSTSAPGEGVKPHPPPPAQRPVMARRRGRPTY